MKIFYRGYMIHRPIPDFDATIYGRLPERTELTACESNREAMEWVDQYMQYKNNPRPSIWSLLALS